jgi:lipopolysaccharide export system protein LptC
MILNIIILWVLILILSGVIWCLYKWYKQEQQEQDERILQLEKRIEKYKSEDAKEIKSLSTALKSLNEGMNKNYLDIQKQLKKKSDKE